jgi:hypothetical protein
MIGEQTATCRYKATGLQDADIEIQMSVQIETAADDPYGDVTIEMRFEPIFPEELEDEFYQRLRNGVHGGVSLSGVPLSPNNITVRILELRVSPSPQGIQDPNDKINMGYLLEVTISGIVETLRRNLERI